MSVRRTEAPIAVLLSTARRTYDGSDLASHFLLREFGLVGDAVVAFVGPCRVPLANMVDLLDVKARSPIRAKRMLHVVAEHFEDDLGRAILRQHLLAAAVVEEIHAATRGRTAARRRGNDVHVGERKLTVSIATRSPVSTLLHFGVNLDPAGAPVPAIGLLELGVDAGRFASRLLARYAEDVAVAARSRAKVRPVP
jgi:hypothetical protein